MQKIVGLNDIGKDAGEVYRVLKQRLARLGVSDEDATVAACLIGFVYTRIAHAYSYSDDPKEALGRTIAYCFSEDFINDLWNELNSPDPETETTTYQ